MKAKPVPPELLASPAVLERLLARTVEAPPPPGMESLGPCRLWTGPPGSNGYGQVWFRPFGNFRPHRLMYVVRHGEPPEDKPELDHICKRKLCIEHVEPVTHAENQRRLWHGLGASGPL